MLIDPYMWALLIFSGFGVWAVYAAQERLAPYEAMLTSFGNAPPPDKDALAAIVAGTCLTSLTPRSKDQMLDEVEADLAAQDAMARFYIGGLTILGLLVTFLGMLTTLKESGAMIQALQSQVDVGVAFRALVAGLNGVLAGMVEAFQRTVMALLASLGLGLWFNLVLKRRQGLMVQVAAAVERFVVPLVQPQASVEDMPETLAQLLTATREGFATIAKDNGLVREVALSSLSALHQMLAERKQAEDQHQSLLNSLNEDLHGTVTSLRGVVERHAELSSQLVAALMTLDSRRQPHILEDLPRVLTSLHTGFERQAEAVGSLNARLMDSQNRQSELMAEQVVALGEMAKAQQDNAQARAAADTAKGLQELRTLFSQLVTLLEARERDVPVQAYRQADVHTSSGEPEAVVAFQGQLLHMILQCLERPWWRRLMDDFGALRDPHHRPKYRRLGHATRRKHDAEATMPSSAGVAGANVTQAQGEAAS